MGMIFEEIIGAQGMDYHHHSMDEFYKSVETTSFNTHFSASDTSSLVTDANKNDILFQSKLKNSCD